MSDHELSRAMETQQRLEQRLLALPHVNGVGLGQAPAGGLELSVGVEPGMSVDLSPFEEASDLPLGTFPLPSLVVSPPAPEALLPPPAAPGPTGPRPGSRIATGRSLATYAVPVAERHPGGVARRSRQAGTLGCFGLHIPTGNIVGLTNFHVACDPSWLQDDPIQNGNRAPLGRLVKGVLPGSWFGDSAAGPYTPDAAAFELTSPDEAVNRPPGGRPLSGAGYACVPEMAVKKYGATTGLTHGTVLKVNVSGKIGYYGWPYSGKSNVLLRGLIFVQSSAPFIKKGDSGAALLDAQDRVVGLCVGTGGSLGVAYPIRVVEQTLDVRVLPHVHEYGAASDERAGHQYVLAVAMTVVGQQAFLVEGLAGGSEERLALYVLDPREGPEPLRRVCTAADWRASMGVTALEFLETPDGRRLLAVGIGRHDGHRLFLYELVASASELKYLSKTADDWDSDARALSLSWHASAIDGRTYLAVSRSQTGHSRSKERVFLYRLSSDGMSLEYLTKTAPRREYISAPGVGMFSLNGSDYVVACFADLQNEGTVQPLVVWRLQRQGDRVDLIEVVLWRKWPYTKGTCLAVLSEKDRCYIVVGRTIWGKGRPHTVVYRFDGKVLQPMGGDDSDWGGQTRHPTALRFLEAGGTRYLAVSRSWGEGARLFLHHFLPETADFKAILGPPIAPSVGADWDEDISATDVDLVEVGGSILVGVGNDGSASPRLLAYYLRTLSHPV